MRLDSATDPSALLFGGGEMAAAVRAFDWSVTPLGPIDQWPMSLRVAVGICLSSRFPMFVWWGPQLTNIYNDAYAPILGKRHPAALGQPARDIWGDVWPVVGPQADAVMQRGQATWNERVMLTMERHGYTEDAYFTWSYSPIPDDRGGIGGLFCACTEETQRVRAEGERDKLVAQLAGERTRLAEVFRQSPGFLAVLRGPEHVFEDINDRYVELVGRRDIIGKRVGDAIPEAAEQGFIELLDRVYASGEPYVGTQIRALLARRPNQPLEERYLDFFYQPIRGPDDTITGILAHGVDVTDRRRADEARRMSEFRFQRLVDQSPLSTQIFAPDGTMRQANRGWETLWGVSPDAIPDYNILKDQQLVELGIMPLVRRAFEGEAVSIDPIPYKIDRGQYAGQIRWCGAYIYPVKDDEGRVEEVVLVHSDVTDRKVAEEALAQSQRRLQTLFENAQDAILLADDEGRYVDVNPAACALTGYSAEELLQRTVYELTAAADRNAGRELWKQFIEAGRQGGEYTLQRKNGSSVDVEYRAVANILPGLHLSVLRDITERKRATDRISRLYGVAAALSEALTSEDVARVTVEQGVGALGATAGSLALLSEDGKTLEMAGAIGYPPEVIRNWHQFDVDARVPLADAVRLAQPIYLDDPQERLRRYPALQAVTPTRPTQSSACMPLLVGGRAIGVLGLSFDHPKALTEEDREFAVSLTRQCAQALERARLYEAERRARAEAERASEAKSQFLATLSHELRTPLTPVLLTISLMESRPDLPGDLREDVATIRRNIELESRLISDLLDLTRISRGKLQLEMQQVDLHLVIRAAIDICQREASAKLLLDLSAKQHTVIGDSTRLQQIFWNLINNAQKFTGPDGTITVRSSNVDGLIRVEVADTGVGIDPPLLSRLFNAFEQGEVRSSRQQAGLGLGLSISRKLAEAHRGTITAASAGRGMGATFLVELPVVDVFEPRALPQPAGNAPRDAQRPLSVLLVEDHASTLGIMSKLLRQLGHDVTGVTSVASALAATRQSRFDLIISDLGLPDGSGLDIMRCLRDRYADRAIALTGYGMESDIAASKAAGFAEHLTKPVDLPTLESAIRRVAAAT